MSRDFIFLWLSYQKLNDTVWYSEWLWNFLYRKMETLLASSHWRVHLLVMRCICVCHWRWEIVHTEQLSSYNGVIYQRLMVHRWILNITMVTLSIILLQNSVPFFLFIKFNDNNNQKWIEYNVHIHYLLVV